MQRSLPKQSVKALFANKFAFAEDEEILVNALDLCGELFTKQKLQHENNSLRARIEWLESLQHCPTYKRFDILA